MLETLIICGSLFGSVGAVCFAFVQKNRDDNKLESEKENLRYLKEADKECTNYELRQQVRTIMWDMDAREKKRFLTGKSE